MKRSRILWWTSSIQMELTVSSLEAEQARLVHPWPILLLVWLLLKSLQLSVIGRKLKTTKTRVWWNTKNNRWPNKGIFTSAKLRTDHRWIPLTTQTVEPMSFNSQTIVPANLRCHLWTWNLLTMLSWSYKTLEVPTSQAKIHLPALQAQWPDHLIKSSTRNWKSTNKVSYRYKINSTTSSISKAAPIQAAEMPVTPTTTSTQYHSKASSRNAVSRTLETPPKAAVAEVSYPSTTMHPSAPPRATTLPLSKRLTLAILKCAKITLRSLLQGLRGQICRSRRRYVWSMGSHGNWIVLTVRLVFVRLVLFSDLIRVIKCTNTPNWLIGLSKGWRCWWAPFKIWNSIVLTFRRKRILQTHFNR